MAYVYDNKTYRNLQQQVKENMDNIAELQDLKLVGIDVAGIVADSTSLPSSADQGQVYAVGSTSPYELYVYNDSSWVDFGEFPKAGPQGEQGPQGEPGRQGQRGLTGPQGPRGYTGAPGTPGQAGIDAGFGSISATAQTLPAGSSATATVSSSGPNTAKELSFTFGIPKGADGKAIWGDIQGNLDNQTDLQTALDSKANTSSLAKVATSGSYNDLSNKPEVGNLVPYTGATKDVNLGEHSATVKDIVATGTTKLSGDMIPIKTFTIQDDEGSSMLRIFRETTAMDGGILYFGEYVDIDSSCFCYGSYEVQEDETISGIVNIGSGELLIINNAVYSRRYFVNEDEITPINEDITKLQTATGSDWEFLDLVAEKTFQKAFTEAKPGRSGIPSGNATVNVTATTWQKKIAGAVVGYKTILDVTCRCEQFNLNGIGSRWFMPMMAVSSGNIGSTKFTNMMDKLNTQKDRVGISVDEVSVFRDSTTNLGSLNLSGAISGQVTYDTSEFKVSAVMIELDNENDGNAIPCTGAHYKINIFHPETIL